MESFQLSVTLFFVESLLLNKNIFFVLANAAKYKKVLQNVPLKMF